MTKELTVPLRHVVRRRMLRWLHENPSACSREDLAEGLQIPRVVIAYHGRVLARWKLIKEAEVSRSRSKRKRVTYSSLVEDDPAVGRALDATKAEDESGPEIF